MFNTTLSSVPRIESLHHRLKSAKGRNGEPLAILDELMVFLEDPPPDTADRWQAGADFCAAHGIATSRPAVWRFYRAHVAEWRREKVPSPATVLAKADAPLPDQAWQILPAHAVETLQHAHLSPRVLADLAHIETRRQELQLARDKFEEQRLQRRREEDRRWYKAIDDAAREQAYEKYGPALRAACLKIPFGTAGAAKQAGADSPLPSTSPAQP